LAGTVFKGFPWIPSLEALDLLTAEVTVSVVDHNGFRLWLDLDHAGSLRA